MNPLLADRDGRCVVASQLFEMTAAGLALVALPWMVISAGGSTAVAGLVYPVTILPYVICGPLAGVYGDRGSRKRIMLAAYAMQAAWMAGLALWGLLSGAPPIWLILLSAFAAGVGRTFVDAASFGAVAGIVGRENFVQGQAALSTSWSAGQIIGALAGGTLIALFGAPATIAVASSAYLAGGLVVALIRRTLDGPVADPERLAIALRAGVATILETPILRWLCGVQAAWYFLVLGTQALLVPLLQVGHGFDAGEVGVIYSSAAAFGLLGAITVGFRQRRVNTVGLVAIAILASAIGAFGLAYAGGFAGALVAAGFFLFAQWLGLTVLTGERQRHAEEHLQARVGVTGRTIALGSMLLGGLAASGLATLVSLHTVFVLAGIAGVCVALVGVPALIRASRNAAHV